IFTQDIMQARRRPIGAWSDICRENFTGLMGTLPEPGVRIMKEAKRVCVQVKNLAERILRLQ
ncbi:MAG: hypothetical protein II877_05240, partial [Synergistaceae bacterium]|nr:hypothetical protein [Synergistaceae bacterium]